MARCRIDGFAYDAGRDDRTRRNSLDEPSADRSIMPSWSGSSAEPPWLRTVARRKGGVSMTPAIIVRQGSESKCPVHTVVRTGDRQRVPTPRDEKRRPPCESPSHSTRAAHWQTERRHGCGARQRRRATGAPAWAGRQSISPAKLIVGLEPMTGFSTRWSEFPDLENAWGSSYRPAAHSPRLWILRLGPHSAKVFRRRN